MTLSVQRIPLYGVFCGKSFSDISGILRVQHFLKIALIITGFIAVGSLTKTGSRRSFFSAGMGLIVNFGKMLEIKMGIDLRRADCAMAE